eukprot:COSAG03_NODE_26864_length_256_cov_1.171975_1_plen_23_part_01
MLMLMLMLMRPHAPECRCLRSGK